MSTSRVAVSTSSAESDVISRLRHQYGCGPVEFAGTENAFYERHLVFDNVVDPAAAGLRERFEVIARSVRDVLSQRWIATENTYARANPKRLYYLSMEFLIGRSLANNLTNLLLDPIARQLIKEKNLDWLGLLEEEPDAGLGNGGLGRLAFFFAGKAAPAYHLAKLIVKFIENLAGAIDGDPAMQGRLKVLFLPEYDVSLAERLIPASDVSNQISTAGYEASGTSNMKFMMNGALTIGTRDGPTIEMAQEAGEENFFLFGLTAEQVAGSRGWYNPQWHYEHEPETCAALDLISSNHFSCKEPGVFAPLCDTLLTHGDHYMHLADLKSYLEADQRLRELYADSDEWARKAILNVAGSGKFSSDRTIAEYASEIWEVKPCPVP